jgi:hypothetical protein
MEPNQPMGPLAPSDPTERNHTAGVRSLRKLASGARVSVARRQHVKCGQISICAADTLPHHVVSPVMSIMLSSDYQRLGQIQFTNDGKDTAHEQGPGYGRENFSAPGYPGRMAARLASWRSTWARGHGFVSRTPARPPPKEERNTAPERAPQPRHGKSLSCLSAVKTVSHGAPEEWLQLRVTVLFGPFCGTWPISDLDISLRRSLELDSGL